MDKTIASEIRMRYWRIDFDVWRKAWFRKGKMRVESVTYAAPDLETAMRWARDECKHLGYKASVKDIREVSTK